MSPAELLTSRLGGRHHGTYGEARCPAHDDGRASLSIRDGESGILVKCHSGCSSRDVVDALKRLGLWPDRRDATPTKPRGPSPADLWRWVIAIWRASRPIPGTLAEAYLRSRGITIPLPPTLRFHPALKHGPSGLILPAMVAAIAGNDHRVIAIQRTYLRADGRGKAAVPNPKLALAPMDAASVRLAPAGDVLGIAEGVETALSALQMFGIPTWASLGLERLGKLEIPATVARIVIFGDTGSEAGAYRARDAYRGRGLDAEVRFPDAGAKDFNDVLMTKGSAA